jgi:hypothetical protein
MRPPAFPSPIGILSETLGVGCSVALLHAIAETTLLGLNGIRPTAADLAIFVVTYCAAAVVLAVVVTLGALARPVRQFLAMNGGSLALRGAIWMIFIAGYTLIFFRIVYYWSGWAAVLWLIAAFPALLIAWLAMRHRGHRTAVLVCSTALVATTLCALQLVHADWGHTPPATGTLAPRLLAPIFLCLAALLGLVKRSSPKQQYQPATHAAAPLALVVALWACYAASLHSALWLRLPAGGSPVAAHASRPNILLIVLDTVRAGHLDLFGYGRQTMPNLTRFAKEHCQAANRMYTTAPWTLPSHASMFTGLYASAHGAHYPFEHDKNVTSVAYPMREDITTLAEFLAGLGYQTAGIVGNYGTLSYFGIPRGFQYYDNAPGPFFFATRILWLYRFRLAGWTPGDMIRAFLPDRLQGLSRMFSVREPNFRRADEISDQAQRWVRQQADRPFFLFLNYMDAHDPYLPAWPDDQRFAKRPAGDDWFSFRPWHLQPRKSNFSRRSTTLNWFSWTASLAASWSSCVNPESSRIR